MKALKIYSIVITLILILIIIGIFIYSFIYKGAINKEEALSIALEYANLKESDIVLVKIDKDYEDLEYEIEFYDDFYTYEFEINYNNGKINNFEKDMHKNNISNTNNISMTEKEAQEIALKKVNKTMDAVTFTKVRIDRENGIDVYDVYFYDDLKEYELSIAIETKEIISYKENYLTNHNQTLETNYIGSEKAKEIVLLHANLKENAVLFKKVELDINYQMATYEIEFYYNYFEYDYEIDAITGEILKYEKEK